MKKTIITICFFITFIIIYLLQANFFSWFNIDGVKPNLFVMLVLFISLFAGIKLGIGYGIFYGLFLDIVIGKHIGINTISIVLVSILGGYFDKNFSKDSKLTIMLMVIVSTLVFEISSYILNIIMLNINVEIWSFIKILVIEIIYNVLITIIIYPIVQTIGYKIEDIFKGQKILTRYF